MSDIDLMAWVGCDALVWVVRLMYYRGWCGSVMWWLAFNEWNEAVVTSYQNFICICNC